MKRQDLRNRTPEFKFVDTLQPRPKKRRTPRLSTVLKVIGVLLLLAALWYTSPSRLFPECRGDDVPRYCVD
jgi:hypothetical protein